MSGEIAVQRHAGRQSGDDGVEDVKAKEQAPHAEQDGRGGIRPRLARPEYTLF